MKEIRVFISQRVRSKPPYLPRPLSSLRFSLRRQIIFPSCTKTGQDVPINPIAVLKNHPHVPTVTPPHAFFYIISLRVVISHSKRFFLQICSSLDFPTQVCKGTLFLISGTDVVKSRQMVFGFLSQMLASA